MGWGTRLIPTEFGGICNLVYNFTLLIVRTPGNGNQTKLFLSARRKAAPSNVLLENGVSQEESEQNYYSGTIKHLAALSQCSISRENLFKQRVPTALARLFDTFEEFYRQRNARATFKQTFLKGEG